MHNGYTYDKVKFGVLIICCPYSDGIHYGR